MSSAASRSVSRFVRIDRVRAEQFSGAIDHGNFHAGANAGIEAHHHSRTSRRGQHEVLEIVAENADCFVFGGFAYTSK